MDSNAITLKSYENKAAEYISGTRQTVTGDNKDWLDRITKILSHNAEILELGSGFGRDATYLESVGCRVQCSDAVPHFIEHLREQGHPTKFINALSGGLGGPYDAVLANMVFLHFTVNEFRFVLNNIHEALRPNGILAFSVRRGLGSEWSNDKLGEPRYYKYWGHNDLKQEVEAAQFKLIDLRDGNSTNPDKIYIIAKPSP